MIVAENLTVHSIYTSNILPLFFGRLGGGIFNESNEAVPNNTALFTSFDGYYRLSFYCTTNYTHSRPVIVVPDGRELVDSAEFGIRQTQRSELYFNYISRSPPPSGIYTCRYYSGPDNPTIVEHSVGIYRANRICKLP